MKLSFFIQPKDYAGFFLRRPTPRLEGNGLHTAFYSWQFQQWVPHTLLRRKSVQPSGCSGRSPPPSVRPGSAGNVALRTFSPLSLEIERIDRPALEKCIA